MFLIIHQFLQQKKIEIVNDIFQGKVDNKVLNFLKLIIEKNRFNEFEFIIKSYSEMLDKKANKKKVEIVSAIKLNFEAKQMFCSS